jgi:uncharacterized protein YabE (DUF348 family)
MALNRGNLGFTTQVGAGVTAAVYTVGSAQTAYIKSILLHNLSSTGVQNAVIHLVQNNGGSVGTASSVTRIARIGISTNDTFFFEPAYPITIRSNNDTIQVYNEGITSNSINVLILGDKEV